MAAIMGEGLDTTTMEPEDDIVARLHVEISKGKCIKFNQSDPFHIGDKYGGIPLNLLTNTVGWVTLLLLFFIIRKHVVQRLDRVAATQWTQIFFSGRPGSADSDTETMETSSGGSDGEVTEPLSGDEEAAVVSELEDNVIVEQPGQPGPDPSVEEDAVSGRSAGTGGFIRNARVLTVQEKKLVDVMGPDAVQYLRFQKYIIIYIFMTSVVSCFIILPLNFTGTQLGNTTDFGHTTLANLNPNNDQDAIILWIHVIIAFLMFPAAIFLMRRFSIGLKMTDTNLKITRTVAIENIPQKMCTIAYLRQHLAEAYPEFPIYDVQVVYNVTRLMDLHSQLENVLDSLKFCKRFKARRGVELSMVPGELMCLYYAKVLQYIRDREAIFENNYVPKVLPIAHVGLYDCP